MNAAALLNKNSAQVMDEIDDAHEIEYSVRCGNLSINQRGRANGC